jgi:hypothetical protein
MPTVFCSPPTTEVGYLSGTAEENLAKEICKNIWTLSSEVNNPESNQKLIGLTNNLIKIYERQGRLNKHPFSSALERILSLPIETLYKK